MENRMNFPGNALRLCIDRRNEDIHGRLYCMAGQEAVTFDDSCTLFMLGEEIFDYLQVPQAYQQKRSFSKVEGYLTSIAWTPWENPLMIDEQQGQCATFDIIVQTRKKTSWQGLLKDAKGNVLASFGSDLELLHKITENIPV